MNHQRNDKNISSVLAVQYIFVKFFPITHPYLPWKLKLAKKLLVNDKIITSRETNLYPKHYI